MPLVRTTPIDPPARTRVWITSFSASGFAPNTTPTLTIEYVAYYEDPTDVWNAAETYVATYSEAEAQDLFDQFSTAYDEMKDALYQILIDKGLEAGTIE